jgi:hypothetical protein
MILVETRDLATAMIRLHGKVRAFSLAGRYAVDCTAVGDTEGQYRWAAAAVLIGELIDVDKRIGIEK